MSSTITAFEHLPFQQEEIRRGMGRVVPTAVRPNRLRPWARPIRAGGFVPDYQPSGDAPTAPSEQMRWVQFALNRVLGVNLPTDGIASVPTRAALRDFQHREGLPVSGFVGPDTLAALQRTRARELELTAETGFAEQELKGAALTADKALADRRTSTTVSKALQKLGKEPQPGLYRFFDPAGRFYTGISTDLRRRIGEHVWCMSHFGRSMRTYELNLHVMPKRTFDQLRVIEQAINAEHKRLGSPLLNAQTELELLELGLA